jgi:NAD(P)-dependent dehydrogenase (short-subunit alcohol dehydrogenase family)
MTPDLRAEVVGPDGVVRTSVTDALRDGGWTIQPGASPGAPLDLGVFVPGDAPPNPLGSTPASEWWSLVDELLTSAFRCARELTPRLSQTSGALIFVSSLFGEIGAPERTACSAAFAGILGMVKALTLEVPSVRFSAVAPPWPPSIEPWLGADVDQGTSPPSDVSTIGRAVAAAIDFLANDREGHLRGQIIRIPSGITT